MAMAVANREALSITQEEEAAVLDWDGFGMPPDGAIDEEKTKRQHYWFVCVTCNGRGVDKPHLCSEGHRTKLRVHLERTIGRQAHASASAVATLAAVPRAEAAATTVARPKTATPPPPSLSGTFRLSEFVKSHSSAASNKSGFL